MDYQEEYQSIVEKFEKSKKEFSDIHEQVVNDMRFGILGEQWDDTEVIARKQENRTTAVYNQCAPLIRNIVNNTLKTAPAIKVHAISNNKKEEAKIYDGIIKHIENLSNSESIYTEAFTQAVAGGFGAWRVVIDENSDEIRLKHIVDPTSIYPDPSATEFDFSDMKYLFALVKMSKDEYETKYPETDCVSFADSTDEDSIVVAEYWYKDENQNVKYIVLNGEEIIEESQDYPGKFIPFCIVLGEQTWINGQRYIKSVISDVKTMQQTRNYMSCEAMDYIAKHAKTPYIIADDSLTPAHMKLWENASTTNPFALPYIGGKTPPTRNNPPPAPISYMEAVASLDKDIRTIVGVRDPLQDVPVTQSGKAVELQISEGHIQTAQWVEHLQRTIKYSGRVIVDLIPTVYNYAHAQRIIGIDGQVNTVNIQQQFEENGELKYINLDGDYDITLSTGPSYSDQRKQNFEKLLELAKINPIIMQVGLDMIVRGMDFAESEELADRIATTLPPEVRSMSKKIPEQQLMMENMQLKQQMNQMQQMMQQLGAELQAKNSELESKNAENMQKMQLEIMKLQQKSESDELNAQTQLEKQAMIQESQERQNLVMAASKQEQPDINVILA